MTRLLSIRTRFTETGPPENHVLPPHRPPSISPRREGEAGISRDATSPTDPRW
jgi:hypothetical protein